MILWFPLSSLSIKECKLIRIREVKRDLPYVWLNTPMLKKPSSLIATIKPNYLFSMALTSLARYQIHQQEFFRRIVSNSVFQLHHLLGHLPFWLYVTEWQDSDKALVFGQKASNWLHETIAGFFSGTRHVRKSLYDLAIIVPDPCFIVFWVGNVNQYEMVWDKLCCLELLL